MPEGAGDAAMVRTIAEQLFSVWKQEQLEEQRKAEKESRRWLSSNVGGWLTALVVVLGGITTGVSTYTLARDANMRSIANESKIAEIKADANDRLARIETKIDLIMEERGLDR